MDEQKKPLTEYLESIDEKADSFLSLVEGQATQTQALSGVVEEQAAQIDALQRQVAAQQRQTQPNTQNEQQILQAFIARSKKEYRWWGNQKYFAKSKALAATAISAVIIFGIISTVLTVKSLKYYAFSLFENIVVFCAIFQLIYTLRAKLFYDTFDLSQHSTDVFIQDTDGVWRDTNKEKNRYKVSRWLGCIAVIGNIICIWASPDSSRSIAATVFEILFFGAIIGTYFAQMSFFCMYSAVYFTGMDMSGHKEVTIVHNAMLKVLMPKDEYEKKFPIV